MIDVLKTARRHFVKAKSPVEREKRRRVRRARKSVSRKVPVSVRDEVYLRDEGQCSFCSEGTRCTETQNIQIDHIRPWAMGGGHEKENLRLLCPAHNRLLAERVYGRERIQEFAKA